MSARVRCSLPFIREQAWLKRIASASTPFIKIVRTRVKASSSTFEYGGWTISFQVKRCLGRGVPRSLRMSRVMGLLWDLKRGLKAADALGGRAGQLDVGVLPGRGEL